MPLPVQVWAPFLQYSPQQEEFARDYIRAQQVWRGELQVWLLRPPFLDGDGEVRWHTVHSGIRVRNCLTFGEQLNCYDIFHVDEQRHVYPLIGTREQSWRTLPEGLYRQWLNVSPQVVRTPPYFTWNVPRIVDGRVEMTAAKHTTGPGAVVPFVILREGDRERVVMGWPPPGMTRPAPVSPETESRVVYGKLQRQQVKWGRGRVDAVLTENDPELMALPQSFRWPGIFNFMFPTGGGIDLLYHRTLMKHCVQDLAEGRRAAALRNIETQVQRLTGEGEAQVEHAWLFPKLMISVQGALAEVEGRYGIAANNLNQLSESADYRRIMLSWIPVRRAHGWVGYFWWELFQDVMSRVTIRFCRSCGNVIRGGHADRQYCSRQENVACVRARNATAQRKSRLARDNLYQRRDANRGMWV